MKIGFDSPPAAFPGTYCQHLVKILAKYAPEHEYVVGEEGLEGVDIYHSFTSVPSQGPRPRGARSVVTVPDLNFLRYPQMYTFYDRLFRIRLYKRSCRSAERLIALNRRAKDELSERLGIDSRKIEVVLPLGVHPPVPKFDREDCEVIRRKYSLPDRYVLTIGVPESRRNLLGIFDALRDSGTDCALVVCGRRTSYSDFLIKYARATGGAEQLEFVYEPALADLPAIFRMAEAYVAMAAPEAEVSILPVVEAMRSGVPVVLSDTLQHRETAAEAGVYVPVGDETELSETLKKVLEDEGFRRCLTERERVRAELFSEYAVAQRLMDIYTSL